MCGISGFYKHTGGLTRQPEQYETLLHSMNDVQRHRGPDGQGIFLDDCCGLAHVRLSILDIKNGAQPMEYKSKYEEYVIVYNGEIYNMHKLRRELEAQGVVFQTTCDTEVILKGFAFYGVNLFPKLNGIFAFAIWERRKKTLTLCRDRLGVKPLFYAKTPDGFVFGSEIKALLSYDKRLWKVSEEGLCELFGLGPAHTPGKTVYADIKEVLPGNFAVISEQDFQSHTYWKLNGMDHIDSL